ncbi:hypothetical protein [Pseudaestuariivita rosea]|uniref:hypothetical protein n=1 Tax=Pseudaestuariivita rosea TaxID=2763263 RepID=UPI001ABAF3A6|nr:hypothetical protein [Pseudaestuariivita rosea]
MSLNVSARMKTLLGSYRPEVWEVDDIPEIIASFGVEGVSKLHEEAEELLRKKRINTEFIEAMTAWELPNDKKARDFFIQFSQLLSGNADIVPDIADFTD